MNYKENWEKTKKEKLALDDRTDQRIWSGIQSRIKEEFGVELTRGKESNLKPKSDAQSKFTTQSPFQIQPKTTSQIQFRRKKSNWYWAAASVLLLLTLGSIVFYSNVFESTRQVKFTMSPIVYESFSKKKEVRLKDGSRIILEPNSKLIVSGDFGEEKRGVNFSGNGYFDIAKDAQKPFVVEGRDFKVRVLGTKFNLTSSSEIKKVELLEGRVSVQKDKEQVLLLPLESWTFKNNRSYHYVSAEVSKEFDFSENKYGEVLSKIEQTYHVEISFPKELKDQTLNGTLSGNLEELVSQVGFPFGLEVKKKSGNQYELR